MTSKEFRRLDSERQQYTQFCIIFPSVAQQHGMNGALPRVLASRLQTRSCRYKMSCPCSIHVCGAQGVVRLLVGAVCVAVLLSARRCRVVSVPVAPESCPRGDATCQQVVRCRCHPSGSRLASRLQWPWRPVLIDASTAACFSTEGVSGDPQCRTPGPPVDGLRPVPVLCPPP